MDPLSVLRDFTVKRQLDQVRYDSDRVKFGDVYSFPKASYTAFKSKSRGDFYTLDEVLFFIQNFPTAGAGEYVRRCQTQGIAAVRLEDRKVRRPLVRQAMHAWTCLSSASSLHSHWIRSIEVSVLVVPSML